MGINYLNGDATNPIQEGNKIIMHIVNAEGGWGAGFVLAISKKWKEPEKKYREWFKCQNNFILGKTQFVKASDEITVANMLAQKFIRSFTTQPCAIDYKALECCLQDVASKAIEENAVVIAPRIGCGLAGSTWDKIEPIIQKHLKDLDIFIYDL